MGLFKGSFRWDCESCGKTHFLETQADECCQDFALITMTFSVMVPKKWKVEPGSDYSRSLIEAEIDDHIENLSHAVREVDSRVHLEVQDGGDS